MRLGFLFKPLGWLQQESLGKVSFIYYLSEVKLSVTQSHSPSFILAGTHPNIIFGRTFYEFDDLVLSIRKFSRGIYFRETSHMRSFVKIKPSRNGKITLSFIDTGKPCLSGDFSTSLVCLLMLFAKIKFSRKFPTLQ